MAGGKKTRAWGRWIIVVLLLCAGGWWWWRRADASTPTFKFETAKITRGDVTALVTATGTLAPVTKVTVGSEVSGVIQKIYIDYNSHVRRGQVLAEIDPTAIRATIEQNKAAVINAVSNYNQQVAHIADAQSAVASADAGIAIARANWQTAIATQEGDRAALSGARAQVEKSRADFENLQRTYERNKILFKKDLVARAELDTAQSQYLQSRAVFDGQRAALHVAEATFRSHQAAVDAMQGNLTAATLKRRSAEAQLEQARAAAAASEALVSQARATLESSEVQLSKTIIHSPVDGIVLDTKVSVGQTVQASYAAPELFVLAENLDVMRLEAAVDEADVGRVKEGATVSFTVDAYADETFHGKVTQVRQSPQTTDKGTSNQSVVLYTALVETKNPEHKLRPGMTATVKIEVARRKDTLLIPNEALRFKPPDDLLKRASGSPSAVASQSPEGRKKADSLPSGEHEQPVWLVSKSNSQELVKEMIRTGITDGTNTEIIKSSLRADDAVVTSAEQTSTAKTNLPVLR